MPEMILLETEEKMEKTVQSMLKDFSKIRTGRASANILDSITVEYYGSPSPVRQISNVSTPEANQLLIKPYDPSTLKLIERAISASDLGITPINDGVTIRLIFPKLTEERRRELVKGLGKITEGAKVACRNIRRDGNDAIKKLKLPEDDEKGYIEDIQKLTDKYIEKIEKETETKEKELMEI
ncbi:MAG: ribosome recycling factor [Acholeplasmatales bacterium]|nr:ribosome recycling factor [Acholeplasmatales bacterium]